MDEVLLVVDGKGYHGWEDVSVQLGMEQLAGSFELTLTDRWPGQAEPRPIKQGQSCVLKLAGQVVISGYIDDVEITLDATSRSLRVRGRDKTGDLVDCSVLVTKTQPGAWKNRTLLQIATDVCKPFGIAVRAETKLGNIRSATVQEGETAYELLDRLAKQAGVLLLTDGTGVLVIASPRETVMGQITEGKDLLSGSASSSWRERYSRYVLKGQRPASNEDTAAGPAHISAGATDAEITRYRPLVVIADGHSSPQTHVAWEARVRNGRSTRAQVTVLGWLRNDELWLPNYCVRLVSAGLQTDDVLMIASVTFTLNSSQGFRTSLELADPASFDVAAGLRASPIGRKARGKNGLIENRAGDKGRAKKATVTQ